MQSMASSQPPEPLLRELLQKYKSQFPTEAAFQDALSELLVDTNPLPQRRPNTRSTKTSSKTSSTAGSVPHPEIQALLEEVSHLKAQVKNYERLEQKRIAQQKQNAEKQKQQPKGRDAPQVDSSDSGEDILPPPLDTESPSLPNLSNSDLLTQKQSSLGHKQPPPRSKGSKPPPVVAPTPASSDPMPAPVVTVPEVTRVTRSTTKSGNKQIVKHPSCSQGNTSRSGNSRSSEPLESQSSQPTPTAADIGSKSDENRTHTSKTKGYNVPLYLENEPPKAEVLFRIPDNSERHLLVPESEAFPPRSPPIPFHGTVHFSPYIDTTHMHASVVAICQSSDVPSPPLLTSPKFGQTTDFKGDRSISISMTSHSWTPVLLASKALKTLQEAGASQPSMGKKKHELALFLTSLSPDGIRRLAPDQLDMGIPPQVLITMGSKALVHQKIQALLPREGLFSPVAKCIQEIAADQTSWMEELKMASESSPLPLPNPTPTIVLDLPTASEVDIARLSDNLAKHESQNSIIWLITLAYLLRDLWSPGQEQSLYVISSSEDRMKSANVIEQVCEAETQRGYSKHLLSCMAADQKQAFAAKHLMAEKSVKMLLNSFFSVFAALLVLGPTIVTKWRYDHTVQNIFGTVTEKNFKFICGIWQGVLAHSTERLDEILLALGIPADKLVNLHWLYTIARTLEQQVTAKTWQCASSYLPQETVLLAKGVAGVCSVSPVAQALDLSKIYLSQASEIEDWLVQVKCVGPDNLSTLNFWTNWRRLDSDSQEWLKTTILSGRQDELIPPQISQDDFQKLCANNQVIL